jgi:protocatechuate 3,4-dioxygenase beta subunit
MIPPGDLVAGRSMRHRTPDQVLGPYFPQERARVEQSDLTGADGIAQGEIIEVTGRILDRNGDPVSGARLTIWQANAFGRYRHPGDTSGLPLDPNFLGNAEFRSGNDGGYRIKTVKPGAYPAGPAWVRPPHIHFEIVGRFERLITQLYFPDEPLNATDRLLNSVLRPDLLIATVVSPRYRISHRVMNFDIVILRG